MKQALITFIFMLYMAVNNAADTSRMVITTGENESAVKVYDVISITFDDNNMAVNLTDDRTLLFPNNDNWSIRFTEADMDDVGTVTIADPKTPVSIFDLNGNQVGQFESIAKFDPLGSAARKPKRCGY